MVSIAAAKAADDKVRGSLYNEDTVITATRPSKQTNGNEINRLYDSKHSGLRNARRLPLLPRGPFYNQGIFTLSQVNFYSPLDRNPETNSVDMQLHLTFWETSPKHFLLSA